MKYIYSLIDISKVEKSLKVIEKVSQIAKPNEIDSTLWISFLSAIIGGVLVIIGQFLIEYFKNKNENKKEYSNIISEIVRQRGILKNLYRELAMYKTHASYWWFCTETESFGVESEKNRQDHLKSQSESRKIEREIGESIATFLGLISKFELVLGKTIDCSYFIEKINVLKTRPANEYDSNQNYTEVRTKIVIKDEMELKEEYFQNLIPFDEIITKLKEEIK